MRCTSCAVPSVVDDQRLGLAAGEERRAVGAREQADLAADRADVVGLAAVDAHALVDDHVAHDLLVQVAEGAAISLSRGLPALAEELGRELALDELLDRAAENASRALVLADDRARRS